MMYVDCPECYGEGHLDDAHEIMCDKCEGRGVVDADEEEE